MHVPSWADRLEQRRKDNGMGALGGFIVERVQSVISKKVGASAVGVGLIASGQPEAGWAAIAYAAIQAIVDIAKYYIDSKK